MDAIRVQGDRAAASDRSTAELTRDLVHEITALMHDEIALANAEMTAKAKRAGIGAGMFGTAGVLTTNVGPLVGANSTSAALAVATYPSAGTTNDGKVVAAGSAVASFKGSTADDDFAVVRYNLNGSIDTSFGGGTVLYVVLQLHFDALDRFFHFCCSSSLMPSQPDANLSKEPNCISFNSAVSNAQLIASWNCSKECAKF